MIPSYLIKLKALFSKSQLVICLSSMRITLFMCLLLILFLGSYQCLANESSGEVYLHGKGRNVSKGDSKGGDGKELDAVQTLHRTLKGGKGGRSMGGGNAQIIRQPPSQRKSSAPPMPLAQPSLLSVTVPWMVSICVLASLAFF